MSEIITGKDLQRIGWKPGKLLGIAKKVALNLMQEGADKQSVLTTLQDVLESPSHHLDNLILRDLVEAVIQDQMPPQEPPEEALRPTPLSFEVWGEQIIDPLAKQQMTTAMRLPVSIAGALMPDAHVGYGLPIGGVLATENTVIPYAVGVDIACRMMLSVFPEPPNLLVAHHDRLRKALLNETHFGTGDRWRIGDPQTPQHEVLDAGDWNATPLLRSLRDKARAQLGTSGSGNHFVEWGTLTIDRPDPETGLQPGKYVALLSHSGSRGVGARIAEHFTKVAKALHPKLPNEAQHLAWLDLSSEEGDAYWQAMQLAGHFAQANHHIIHRRVARAAGLEAFFMVENHHNFAWKELLSDGREAIIHRKGATPAGAGVLGIIPGSMGDVGYLVRGLGHVPALNSASHGAGRLMSRKAATSAITLHDRNEYLQKRGVTLLSGGLDEAPQAYKPIGEVMAAQTDLVETLARFNPVIVRMA